MKLPELLQKFEQKNPKESRGVKARFIITGILSILALLAGVPLGFAFLVRPVIILGSLALLGNILSALWIISGRKLQYRIYLAAFFDFLVLTIAFHFLGGIEAPLAWIYAVALIAYSSLYGVRIGLFAALVSSLMYTILLSAEFKGVIRHIYYNFLNPIYITENSFYLYAKLLTDNALFFITALISGTLAERLIHTKDTVENQNERLRLEIAARIRVEKDLQRHREELEQLVAERTESLRESEKRYRLLAENITDLIWTLNIESLQFTYVSPSVRMIRGYTVGEAQAQTLDETLTPDSLEVAMSSLAGQLTAEKMQSQSPWSQTMELEHTCKDGSTVWGEVTVTFVLDQNGKPVELIGVTRDITERKRAEKEKRKLEAQIQHAQKLESLGVLAGGIAHDFNNLLTGVLGNAQLALINLSPASPARQKIEEIEKAADRAADLCNQMLAYSGKGRFVIEPINLNEVVFEMTHLLEVSISKKATLRFNFAGNLPAIEADVTQIRQVVMNLITNASDAVGHNNGIISITTGAMECDRAYLTGVYLDEQLEEGRYAYLEVSDSGCGMDKDTVKRIFDPFFTTKFTGRGLGLAAVLGIIRGHKGTVKIYSELGKGTSFKVLFPALDNVTETKIKTCVKDIDWRGSGTVLLVDDEEIVRTTAGDMLKEMGFTVLPAKDGREAVEIFREHADEIVMVLLDLTMPYMSGEETFLEIRRIKPNARIMVSSGYNEQEVSKRFVGKGLAGFIQKPFRYQALREKVQEVLKN